MINLILILGLVFGAHWARATVSINTSASSGYYRDSAQSPHVPLYYNLSYSGEHEGGVESSLDLVLNNDFYVNNWSIIPSQALVIYPLSKGYAPYRRSRIQLGRQFFTESFDMALLDGMQLPVYWSQSGGFTLYGGNSHTMDLLEPGATLLGGVSIFEKVLSARIKLGFSERGTASTANNTTPTTPVPIFYGSLIHQWDEIILSPQILLKGEYDDIKQTLSQSLAELVLNPSDSVALTGRYSNRQPRSIAPDQNIFLYSIFAKSAQETEEATLNFQLSDSFAFQALGRLMKYNSGLQVENGNQEQLSFSWLLTPYQRVSPYFDNIMSYGGTLWDYGLLYQIKVNDYLDYRVEFGSAYFDKVNNIVGWAHDLRTGVNFQLASHFTAMTWLEFERNPLFEFDSRILANVTFFN